MDIDYEQLAARILRPDRPRLAEARAAVAGITDPAEAWEVVRARGLASAPGATAFVAGAKPCGPCGGQGRARARWGERLTRCDTCRGSGRLLVHTDAPPTVGAVVALASDPRGVATVEALAREVLARVASSGDAPAPRLAWRLGDARDLGDGGVPDWLCEGARANRVPAYPDIPEAAALGARVAAALEGRAARDAVCAAGMALQAAAGRRMGYEGYEVAHVPARLWHVPYADLPNPFEPLVAIWQLGYALDRVVGDAAVLVAPEVADDA